MKELDCKLVVAEIERQLDATDYDIETLIGRTLTVMMVMGIYLTNDILDAHGQDLKELGVSIITTRYRCSIIIGKDMSWYKDEYPICEYVTLEQDIDSILSIIQTVIDRIDQ